MYKDSPGKAKERLSAILVPFFLSHDCAIDAHQRDNGRYGLEVPVRLQPQMACVIRHDKALHIESIVSI